MNGLSTFTVYFNVENLCYITLIFLLFIGLCPTSRSKSLVGNKGIICFWDDSMSAGVLSGERKRDALNQPNFWCSLALQHHTTESLLALPLFGFELVVTSLFLFITCLPKWKEVLLDLVILLIDDFSGWCTLCTNRKHLMIQYCVNFTWSIQS